MPYFDAMTAFVPQGRAMARLLYGCPGIQVPGGIGPQVRGSKTLPCVGSHTDLCCDQGMVVGVEADMGQRWQILMATVRAPMLSRLVTLVVSLTKQRTCNCCCGAGAFR